MPRRPRPQAPNLGPIMAVLLVLFGSVAVASTLWLKPANAPEPSVNALGDLSDLITPRERSISLELRPECMMHCVGYDSFVQSMICQHNPIVYSWTAPQLAAAYDSDWTGD